MQSKGAVKFLAILFAIICLYHLSFTLVTWRQEKAALEATGGDPVKYKAYLDSLSTQTVYNLGVKKYTYQECKEKEINLGLDLKGGMNVTMEVGVQDLVRNMSNNPNDVTLNKAVETAMQMQQNSQEDFVTLFGRAFDQIAPGQKLAALYTTMDLQSRVNFNSTNPEVVKVIKQEADAAISRTYNILRTRIDKFGVTQPNIQQLGAGRILIELPGVKEPERVRKLLQGTAKLEFWETYDNAEAFPFLEKINTAIKTSETKDSLLNSLNGDTTNIASAAIPDSTALATIDSANKKPSLLDKIESDTNKAPSDTSAEAQFAKFSKENPFFSLVTPAIFQNQNNQSEYRKGPVVGYVAFKDTGKVNEILSRPEVKSILPRDLKFLWSAKGPTKDAKILELIAVKVKSRDGSAPLDGGAIADARQDFGQFNSSPEISMTMNPEGAKTWKRLTGENVNKSIAIVLDNLVYSYPNVIGEIAGGRSSITGNFEISEAQDLANILKAGKLPAPAHIVSEAVVGPSLGQEAINSGLMSFVIAFLIVLAYMAFYYNKAGLVANVALLCNMFFIIGVLSAYGAVLTLPGIAGIVLVIGMSVDANILIFERVREELAAGKGMRLAISDGFKHALSSIVDSNLTTLILGIILFVFGSGPIQGFATTLIIGILTSMFSALFITRLILEWLLGKNKEISFGNSMTINAFRNFNFNFVGNRKKYYIISSIIIVAGITSLVTKGFNFGVDFKGGRSYVVQFAENVQSDKVREQLSTPFISAPEVKTFGTDNRLKITTTYLIESNSSDAEAQVTEALYNGLKSYFPNTDLETFKAKNIITSAKVGATVADDIKSSAVWSILISCLLMFIYIWIRFKKWQFGIGATIALFHDALVVMAIYTICNGIVPFTLEVDQAFIAAVLTVMGYSMTDTVVVFDRIREFLGMHRTSDMKPVINNALNATLSRTMNTSLTTFFTLLAIFIFGGDVIRGFTFALLVGIVVGTYSSLCVATPVLIDLTKNNK